MEEETTTLIKALIDQLDIDGLLNFYQTGGIKIQNALENPETLRLLSRKYRLPNVNNFNQFINDHDEKYVPIRCRRKHSSKECFLRAARVGNLATIKELLKDYKPAIQDSLKAVELAGSSENHGALEYLVALSYKLIDMHKVGSSLLVGKTIENIASSGRLDIALSVGKRFLPIDSLRENIIIGLGRGNHYGTILAIIEDPSMISNRLLPKDEILNFALEGAIEGGHLETLKKIDHDGRSYTQKCIVFGNQK